MLGFRPLESSSLSDVWLTSVMEDRDFLEWHRGLERYGFWCLRVSQSQWLEDVSLIQRQLRPFLVDGYSRFPHVTLATVGLMTEENWDVVDRQVSEIESFDAGPIELSWDGLSSYVHCPIIRVAQQNGVLGLLRRHLHRVSIGDDASGFDPHITLGYYAVASELEAIFQCVDARYGAEEVRFTAGELLFCTYETDSIKGPIDVVHRLDLNGPNFVRNAAEP